MKNRIRFRQLGRDSAHLQALFRDLVTALVEHGRIRTTLAKAKEVRRHAEKAVTWAKEGQRHHWTLAGGFLRTPDAVKKLMTEVGPRYKDRAGGYTRVLRAGYRRGDRAPMAILEFVDRPGEVRPARPARAGAGVAAPPPSLESRLQAVLARQAELKTALSATKPGPTLVPAFPRPQPSVAKWTDAPAAWRARIQRATASAAPAPAPAAAAAAAAAPADDSKAAKMQ